MWLASPYCVPCHLPCRRSLFACSLYWLHRTRTLSVRDSSSSDSVTHHTPSAYCLPLSLSLNSPVLFFSLSHPFFPSLSLSPFAIPQPSSHTLAVRTPLPSLSLGRQPFSNCVASHSHPRGHFFYQFLLFFLHHPLGAHSTSQSFLSFAPRNSQIIP